MFWLIKFIQGLISTLNADISRNEIAAGIVLGASLGLIPKNNLLALAIWLVIWTFRVNIGMAGASIFVFAVLGHFTDPLAEKLGFWALSAGEPLRALWIFLYNKPIVPFTGFNETLVMGNLILSLLIAVPLFFLSRRGVEIYRERYRERVMQWPIYKFFKVSNYVDLAQRWKNR